MIILFLLFLLQFALACACLAVNQEQQRNIVIRGWNMSSDSLINQVQTKLNCCGFEGVPKSDARLKFVPCSEVSRLISAIFIILEVFTLLSLFCTKLLGDYAKFYLINSKHAKSHTFYHRINLLQVYICVLMEQMVYLMHL